MSKDTTHLATVYLLTSKTTEHTVDWISSSYNINNCVLFSIQTIITAGTLRTGTFTIEASNDNTNFTIVDTQSITTGALSYIYNPGLVGYSFIRVRYVSTAGTGGAITSIINCKVI